MAPPLTGPPAGAGWILVTNDDGIDARGLPALARALGALAPVEVVAPDRERSWIGKALTRFDSVQVERVERGGLLMHAVSGYPADCVQLGVHTLFAEPPALVVSGINVGYNHGAAFLGSSGTVGAAIEAAIAGVSGVALSTGSQERPWAEWRAWVQTAAAETMWERLAGLAADLARPFLDAPPGLVVSVNIPDDADADTPRRQSAVAPVAYGRLFGPAGDGEFAHNWDGGLRELGPLSGTDVEAAGAGVVSIARLAPPQSTDLPPRLAAALGVSS